MRATSLLAPGLLLFTMLTGCATVVHGTTQTIPITSSPAGATVLIDDVPVGVTPMSAKVSRKQPHVVSFVVDSVTKDRVWLDRQMSPWVFADVFLLYVAPIALDVRNGAAYNFPGDTLRAQFGSTFAGLRRLPISDATRAMARTSASMIGFGSGHAVVDLPARSFLLVDLAASSAMIGGFIAGYSGSDAGAAVFFTGGAVFIGSRIWQIADLAKRLEFMGR